MAKVNPYTVREDDDAINYDALGPLNSYAAPGLTEDDAYYDEAAGNWSPKIGGAYEGGSDAHRLGTVPRRDFRPNPSAPADQGFYHQRDADTYARHNVESVDADGWQERQSNPLRFAPNPRSFVVADTRPTMSMAPRSYNFTRPFDVSSARQFNGTHFSMADHRRTYETHGMAPVRTARNTYRIEPRPWDENVVDVPAESAMPVNAKITSIEVAPSQGRSYRLGE